MVRRRATPEDLLLARQVLNQMVDIQEAEVLHTPLDDEAEIVKLGASFLGMSKDGLLTLDTGITSLHRLIHTRLDELDQQAAVAYAERKAARRG